jgi:hypothetical protein
MRRVELILFFVEILLALKVKFEFFGAEISQMRAQALNIDSQIIHWEKSLISFFQIELFF